MTNAPEIRFKGYTNAWEQRTVGEYGFFYYGKSAPKWSVASDAPTPCVRYGELYAKYNEKIDKILSRTNIPPEQLKFSKGHEVLVPRVGEEPLDFANCSWLSIPDIAIGEMISVYNTEQNPLFVALYFNAMLKHEFAEKVEGGNVSNLYYDRLIDIPVKFPSVKEQELIAMLFDKLNNTIAIYKRKLDGLRELKKAYLQQMFPQAGEAVPRVRFEGFSGKWEQRKLGEVVDIIMGQSPDSDYYTKNPSDHILVQGNADIKNGKVVPRVYTKQVTKTANTGDLIISVRAPVGDVGKTDYDVVLGRGVAGIKGNEFIYQTLQKMNCFGYWKRIIQGSTFESINSDDLREAIIFIPTLPEQIVIGNFFRNLDGQIAEQSKKIAQLSRLKSAYLQKMLV